MNLVYFFLTIPMAVEHHYHSDTTPTTDSSAMTVIVAIVAILFIIGLGIFALRSAGYGTGTTVLPGAGTDNGINVDVDMPTGGATTGGAAPSNP